MNIQRASFTAILAQLFKTGGREYSLLHRVDTSLDNLYFEKKGFDELLHIVLEQGNCDYMKMGEIYYIFEIQRKDVLKKFKDTMVIQLRHISVGEVVSLLPGDYSGSSFIKTNAALNCMYLTGSTDEIKPIADFIALLDVAADDKPLRRFDVQYLAVKDFIALLPRNLASAGPVVLPESNSFIVQVSGEQEKQFQDYIKLADRRNSGIPVQLKYISSEELTKNLPPSVVKEELVVSADPTLVFYTGTEEKQKQFLSHLGLIDQPKPQIRYQLLVIQYQKSDNLLWNKSLTVTPTSAEPSRAISGTFSNLLNINFDIVSGLGYNFALQLNMQIGEDKAKVLADTTLNGISGQDIKFENTNTFRYRDVAIDPETGKPLYTGTTREINSGLVLGINGWVSGDGMITMKVNAKVSKQDSSGEDTSETTNPPPTSERVVNTQVRTKSGTPIIIGGLLQVEKNESIKKLPLLGNIPLLGLLFQDRLVSEITTEMVIYIVPYIHTGESPAANYDKKNESYLAKYVFRKDG
jgi:type II secretory pathway component GspD/PulD (secretin)